MIDLKPIIEKILLADEVYYGGGTPIMTDQEYDALKQTVRSQDPNHPVLAKIGHPPSGSWKKASHSIPMGSLDKVHSEAEFRIWAARFPGQKMTLQYKCDGLSLSLDYAEKAFQRGITRGDGTEGEDVSDNIVLMQGYQARVPSKFTGSIRAEAILSKENLQKINSILPEDDAYENTRNAASGIIRRQDGRFCQYLEFLAYDIDGTADVTWFRDLGDGLNEDEKLHLLANAGFNTPPQWVGDVDAMVAAFEELKKNRKDLPIDIDGAVIKVCSKEIQDAAGWSRGRPRAQIAWKFDPPGAATTFLEETWDVGRTGVVTPLAHLEPVKIEGSTITKATLHNIAEIARLGIGRGDLIMVIKAGDIIPQVQEVLEHKGKPIVIPTTCPSCNNELINNGVNLRCPNDACPGKNFHRIMNWIKVTKIDQFGEALASTLSAAGKLKKIEDIYSLTAGDISSLEGWGASSAAQVITNIDAKRQLSAAMFLTAIGIPSISERTSDTLLAKWGTIDALLAVTEGDVSCLHGFSEISARKIVTGLKKHEPEIRSLMGKVSITTGSGGLLAGQMFCFTGSMTKPRSFYQGIVTKQGGKNLSAVTKGLTYLVCNEDQGSTKSRKAKEYGVKVITEQEFLTMTGQDQWQDVVKKPQIELPSLFEEER